MKPSSPLPRPFEPGDQVQTPSGSVADVQAVYDDDGEALVQWSNGDRARFKFALLRVFPDREKT